MDTGFTDECEECGMGAHESDCPRRNDHPSTEECEECGLGVHDEDCAAVLTGVSTRKAQPARRQHV